MIDLASRAQLLDDSFNLANAELINMTIFLKLVNYLKFEEDSLPFKSASEGLAFFNSMLIHNYTIHKVFKVF